MKTNRLFAALAGLSALTLGACSTTESGTAQRRPGDEARVSYSQNQLKKTGENTVGEGLAKADPSVQISTNGR